MTGPSIHEYLDTKSDKWTSNHHFCVQDLFISIPSYRNHHCIGIGSGSILPPLTPPILKFILLFGLKLGPNAKKVMLHAIFSLLIAVFSPAWGLTL